MTIYKIKDSAGTPHDIHAAKAYTLNNGVSGDNECYITSSSTSAPKGALTFGSVDIFDYDNKGIIMGGSSHRQLKIGGGNLEYDGTTIPNTTDMYNAINARVPMSTLAGSVLRLSADYESYWQPVGELYSWGDGLSYSSFGGTLSLEAATTSTLGGVKIGSNITISSGTISLTKANVTTALGYTPPTSDTNTTYTFATGDSNGQIKVTPSGGSATNISVKGLGTAAYTASTAYATAAQGTLASNAMPKSGGTFTGAVTCNSSVTLKGGVEVYGSTPYIDFHYNNSTADNTQRIIADGTGDLTIRTGTSSITGASAHLNLQVTNSKYTNVGVVLASTDVNDCNSFFRPITAGKAGLGSDSYRWYRLWTANSTNTSSDEREKSDIMSMEDYPVTWSRSGSGNVFEKLFDKLVPKTYTLNIEPTDEIHMGFIAQDIANAFEELGLSEDDLGFISHSYWTDEETGEEKDRYGLAYEEFIALNTYMIQKQKAKIEEQQAQITDLEERIEKLEQLLGE